MADKGHSWNYRFIRPKLNRRTKPYQNLPSTGYGFVPNQVCNLKFCIVGARLRSFWKNWEKITRDRWILDTVKCGMSIDFVRFSVKSCVPRAVTLSEKSSKNL